MMPYRGLIVDWGGVLTPPTREAIMTWVEADGIDAEHYVTVVRERYKLAYTGDWSSDADDPAGLVHGLECGLLAPAEFEVRLAGLLRTVDGSPVEPAGLLDRMFRAFVPVEPMYAALRLIRATGVRTCLLSNSWGNDYPRDLLADAFDEVVISAEVGMRKPDPEIFACALERLGLTAADCVFVDDVAPNVAVASELGMTVIRHTAVETTMARLAEFFGRP